MRYSLKTIAYIVGRRYLKNFFFIKERIGLKKTIYQSYKLLKTKTLGLPQDIAIESAGYCNLKCPMCIQAKSMAGIQRKSKTLSLENFKKVVDDIKGFAVNISLYHAGEPLLNKSIGRFIDYANRQGILTYINTNGVLLSKPEIRSTLIESGLFRMHISFDGATKKTYESYRIGANFEAVKESVRALIRERGDRKTPIVGLQTLATTRTLPEFDAYVEMARDLGVDYAFAATKYVDQYRRNPSPEDLEDLIVGGKFSRYEKIENDRLVIKKPDYPTCPYLNRLYILSDGTVVHCCYDYEAEYTFGNAFESGVRALWNSRPYRDWRNNLAKPMKLLLCKDSCTASVTGGWVNLYTANHC